MQCEKCGLEMFIDASRPEVEGDKSPNTQTKVYTVLSLSCHNPQCPNKGKVIEQKIQIYPAADA